MPQPPDCRYVGRWPTPGSPQPFECKGLSGYGFIVPGTLANIEALCDRFLCQPTNGQQTYRPLTHHVLVTITHARSLSPQRAPYCRFGWMPETEAIFWLLVTAVKPRGAVAVAQRVVSFIPYAFVDNPLAMTAGREVFGFPKEIGWLEMPTDPQHAAHFSVDTIAVKRFAAGNKARPPEMQRHRLFEINRVRGAGATARPTTWRSLVQAADDIKQVVFADGSPVVPGVRFAEELLHDLGTHELSLVFLRQLFDVADGTRACYQAIAEAPVQIDFHRGMLLPGTYELTLHDFDSHPIRKDLGLKRRQRAVLSFWVEWDFTMDCGHDVWTASAAASASSPQPSWLSWLVDWLTA